MPEGWCWTNVSDIAYSILYGVSESAKSEGEYRLLRITDIQDNTVNWSTVPYTNYDESKVSDYLLKDGDILFARTGATVGKSYLVKGINIKAIYASYLIRVQTFKDIMPEYVKYFFESGFYWEQIQSSSVGIGQPNVNGTILSQIVMPIPPRKEQRRIVDNLRGWLSIIDIIENCKDNLQTFINQAKSKILDLAIHGKLVPQDPTDEPACELLKRINPNAEITCDTPHYRNLPIGWCLVRGKSLFEPMKSTKPNGTFFKYIDIDSIDNKRQRINKIKELKSKEAPSRACRYTEKGDIVFSMVRPYLRNIAKVTDGDCIASTGFYICRTSKLMLSDFCYYLMLSDYVVNGLNQFMKGDNSPSINKSNIEDWYYPLPPYKEQQRIVNAINKAFTTLDAISENL